MFPAVRRNVVVRRESVAYVKGVTPTTPRTPPDYTDVPTYALETELTAERAYLAALRRHGTATAAERMCAARIEAIESELRGRGVALDPESP